MRSGQAAVPAPPHLPRTAEVQLGADYPSNTRVDPNVSRLPPPGPVRPALFPRGGYPRLPKLTCITFGRGPPRSAYQSRDLVTHRSAVIGFPGRDARPRERGSFVRGQASRERGRMDIGPLGAYRTPRRPDERLGLGRTSRRRSDGGNHTLSRKKRRGPHRPLWNVCSYGSQSRRRRARIVVRTTIPLVSSFIHPS